MLWDNRYTEGLPSLLQPDPFFVQMNEQYFPEGGKVLDLAAGLGRHTLYLTERNWQATAVDISSVAIDKLKAANTQVEAYAMDIADYELPEEEYDLVILYYHFDRALFPKIFRSLKKGGLFICKLAVSYKPSVEPLQKGELLSLVKDFETISHDERPVKERGVVEYLGWKK